MITSRNKIRTLQRALFDATTYKQWRDIAWELDDLEGNAIWRARPDSPHYDHELIREHLLQIRRARRAMDFKTLHALIEESLHRNLGDLSNQALYEYSYVGTKDLIVEYLGEMEATFDWLCDAPMESYPDKLKLAMVSEAWKVLGRSALILSGGGALGLFHLGVVKALWSRGLLPEVISGASMGAIVAGGVCVRNDDDLEQLWDDVEVIDRQAVKLQFPTEWLKTGSLLSPDQLVKHVTTNVGEETFAQAFARTGRVLNIAVSPTRHRQKPRLLNHLTSPDVIIAHAVTASCSLPALFPPHELMRRTNTGDIEPYIPGEKWVDGSIHGDVPTMRLGRLHNVNHYIVSQANPHILPFAKMEGAKGMVPATIDIATSGLRAQGKQLLNLARRRFDKQSFMRPTLEFAHAMAHQNYTGNINIHPRLRAGDYLRIMKNPSLEELQQFILDGERATWPKIAMIRDQTRLSRSMLRCIRKLKVRMSQDA